MFRQLSIASIIIWVAFFAVVEGFQSICRPSSRIISRGVSLFESKDDEIAKLEEQLRKLKEEKEKESEVAIAVPSDDAGDELKDIPLEMFLTEQWKAQESKNGEASSGGGFSTVLFAVGTVLALLLFSQVPIGQEDLSKYSVGNSPSSQQIDLGDLNRARRSGDL